MWLDWLVFCDGGFQSVCPMMEKDKRLMKGSWWERLTEGETGFCSVGGAMLSKSLIQFSVDGWGCVPSLLFTWGQTMVEVMKIMVTSKCFWTVVLEKTLESPLDCKEIQPVHPKGNQSRMFIERTDVEAETPILWPPGVKNWLIGKDSDVGKDWRQEEKGTTEDEMVGWHHWLNGHDFE